MSDRERCDNCLYQSWLILWERELDGRYLPNYAKMRTCCTALVRQSDGTNCVYGHTEQHDDGICEMYTERKDNE